MTVAAYNLENQSQIPVYVWPAVLGVSVALHVSLFAYGLPNMTWDVSVAELPPETEVLFESGGPVFEEVATLQPDALIAEPTTPEQIVEPVSPAADLLPVQEAAEAPPLESLPIEPAEAVPEAIVSETVPVLAESAPDETLIVEAQEVESVAVEDAEVLPAVSVDPQPVETVEVPVSLVAPVTETKIVSQPVVQLPVSTVETGPPLTVVTPDLPAVSVPEIEAEPQEATSIVEAPILSSVPNEVVAPVPLDVPDVTVIEQVSPETDIAVVAPVSNPTIVAGQEDVVVSASEENSVEVVESVSQSTTVVSSSPADGVSAETQEDTSTLLLTLDSTIALTPIENTITETVAPETQLLDAVEPEETVVSALTPSEPETSVVPPVEPRPDPAEVVPPVQVATIDPLAKVTSYVQNYDLGDCAHLSVLSAGADSAQVTAFGSGIGPFAVFDQRFSADQGYEASIELRLVTRQQCALLNALGVSEGLEAAGLVELDKTVVKSGTLATGLIQRDLPIGRIAAAEATGLDLGGKGPPELYLIDDAGQIHDGREFLLPAPSAQTAGGWRFKVPVVLMSRSESETALVLAIWNRPAGTQPARFGTLPSSRIAGILAAPGVYSLAAFKVSR